MVQKCSDSHTGDNAEQRQHHVFTVHVRCDFTIEEAEHFQRRQFSLPLGDVDVVQVVQHHKRQQARRYDQHDDDDVE